MVRFTMVVVVSFVALLGMSSQLFGGEPVNIGYAEQTRSTAVILRPQIDGYFSDAVQAPTLLVTGDAGVRLIPAELQGALADCKDGALVNNLPPDAILSWTKLSDEQAETVRKFVSAQKAALSPPAELAQIEKPVDLQLAAELEIYNTAVDLLPKEQKNAVALRFNGWKVKAFIPSRIVLQHGAAVRNVTFTAVGK